MIQRNDKLEGRVVEITKAKKKKMSASLRGLWYNNKCNNICIIGVPSRRSEKGIEKIFEEIIAENFPTWERKQTARSRKYRE